ncbi:protein kinase, partial [bacterium AH-315-E10]|nr:protein kinase [bacterium AH-315-E10]
MIKKTQSKTSEIARLRNEFNTAGGTKDSATLTEFLVRNDIDGTKELHSKRDPMERISDDERRYQIGDLIAEGGMGAVFDVRDNTTCRHIAMKVVLGDDRKDESAMRFIDEAIITAQLEHPNIVPIHEIGLDTRNCPYYTMKLIHGRTLKDILSDLKKGDARTLTEYPLSRLIGIFLRVCDAVAFAHSNAVIHRDLKPENIMVADFGEVQVMDWGIAKLIPKDRMTKSATFGELGSNSVGDLESKNIVGTISSTMDFDSNGNVVERTSTPKSVWVFEDIESVRQEDDAYATMRGKIPGTPMYMSPEQACSKLDELDGRSDIYSLGVILYQILSLQVPFMAKGIQQLLLKVATEESTPADELTGDDGKPMVVEHCPGGHVPHGLSAVAQAALRKDPDARYQRVTDMQADIELWQGGFATSVETAGRFYRLMLLLRRHAAISIIIGSAISAMIILVIGFLVLSAQATESAVIRAEEARLKLEELAGEVEKTNTARNEAVQALLGQAARAMKKRKWKVALSYTEKAALSDPASVEALYQLAGLALTNHRFFKAVDALDQAMRIQGEVDDPRIRQLMQAAMAYERKAKRHGGILSSRDMEGLRDLLNGYGKAQWAAGLEDEYVRLAGSSKGKLRALAGVIGRENPEVTDFQSLVKQFGKKLLLDLSGNKGLRDISRLKEQATHVLVLKNTDVSDISVLKGMPISQLSLTNCPVSDISVLKGMRLKVLSLAGTQVTDLSVLKGMPLEKLSLAGLSISDLSVLDGMPLKQLNILGCTKLKDVSLLKQFSQLEKLSFDPGSNDVRFLHDFPALKRIITDRSKTSQTADEFWAIYNSGIFRVKANLKAANPGYEMEGTFSIVDGNLTGLDLSSTKVTDLSPLKGMPLTVLNLAGTRVADLSPLRGMPLTDLILTGTIVSDLRPLRGMQLTSLGVSTTKVTDLTPLRGMELTQLDVGYTKVTDLRPLKGMSLTVLSISDTAVSDISPLKGMALTSLSLKLTRVSDLSVLKGMPLIYLDLYHANVSDLTPLKDLPLERLIFTSGRITKGLKEVRNIKTLTKIGNLHYKLMEPKKFWQEHELIRPVKNALRVDNPGYKGGGNFVIEDNKLTKVSLFQQSTIQNIDSLKGMPLTSLNLQQTRVSDLSPLKDMPLTSLDLYQTRVSDLTPLIGMLLTVLNAGKTTVTDLSPLKGMPLSHLSLERTSVSDLSPLKGMPLTSLNLQVTDVSDLTPLEGMTLTYLILDNTKVTDLTPLKGMPLTSLNIGGVKVTDLTPLEGMPLTYLYLVRSPASDLSSLKDLPLESLVFTPERITKGLKEVRNIKTLTRIGTEWNNLVGAEEFWTSLETVNPIKNALKATNPGYDGQRSIFTVTNGKLTSISCWNQPIKDISPLKGLPLTALTLNSTNVTDLSPLKGMPLTTLNLYHTQVSDLKPLKGMPLTNLR